VNPTLVASEIGNMTPEEVANLPQNVLTQQPVMDVLTPAMLEKMTNINSATRSAIGWHILNVGTTPGMSHPAFDYVAYGPQQHLWK
jgi:hypothetical protein